MSENQGNRQDAMSENQSNRQKTAKNMQGNYNGGGDTYNYNYGGGGCYNCGWDNGDAAAGFVAGAIVGGAVVAASTPTTTTTVVNTAPAGLPCTPNTAVYKGVTYYQCGTTWYEQAYGSNGVIYMPVPPPGN